MPQFDILNIFKKDKKTALPKKEVEIPQETQLLQILGDVKSSPELFQFLVSKLSEQSGEEISLVKEWFHNVNDSSGALNLAKTVDKFLGSGTFRKLSFISSGADAQRNLLKILSKDLRSKSFEGQAEKGLYLNIKENYGVEWTLEKGSRDILQNFFDGNNQTLDGINITTIKEGRDGTLDSAVHVKIEGKQEYDWRELVHLGASTKSDLETTAGGFGEGTKILALILIRDYGAKKVKFASGEWEVDFYIDKVPHGSYRNHEDRGLFIKKKKKKSEKGNTFEVDFEGEKAVSKAEVVENAKRLFYSSENTDFKNPSFENKKTGGFSIIQRTEDARSWKQPRGNLYIAGQRIHYNSREEWNNIDSLNIWTWRKVTPKDRDRGMITSQEVKEYIIPLIVESMSVEDAKKSVRDFEPWYEEIGWPHVPNYVLLEAIVDKLAKEGVKMEFTPNLLANNLSLGTRWIADLLKDQGYKMCPVFMQKIGMITSLEQFKKLQEHNRLPETAQERKKIELLQEAAKLMDFPIEDQKEVWVFGAEAEKSIFHGQYNPDFFWLARENLSKSFFDSLHTYVHEAAHKAGPHGNAKFEYTLQEYIKKIQLWMHNKKEEYERIEEEWNLS